jgi:hypothetical protein
MVERIIETVVEEVFRKSQTISYTLHDLPVFSPRMGTSHSYNFRRRAELSG